MTHEEKIDRIAKLLDDDAKAAAAVYGLKVTPGDHPQHAASRAFMAGAGWVIDRMPQYLAAVTDIATHSEN